MKPLPLTLRKNGFDYTQVQRGRRACIYAQGSKDNHKEYFEVFQIRTKKEELYRNKIFQAREIFPPDSAFGFWAWSFMDYNKATLKFQELENMT